MTVVSLVLYLVHGIMHCWYLLFKLYVEHTESYLITITMRYVINYDQNTERQTNGRPKNAIYFGLAIDHVIIKSKILTYFRLNYRF